MLSISLVIGLVDEISLRGSLKEKKSPLSSTKPGETTDKVPILA